MRPDARGDAGAGLHEALRLEGAVFVDQTRRPLAPRRPVVARQHGLPARENLPVHGEPRLLGRRARDRRVAVREERYDVRDRRRPVDGGHVDGPAVPDGHPQRRRRRDALLRPGQHLPERHIVDAEDFSLLEVPFVQAWELGHAGALPYAQDRLRAGCPAFDPLGRATRLLTRWQRV